MAQLYDVVQKWDAMATSLPQVVQRLIAVKELHEQGNISLSWVRISAHPDIYFLMPQQFAKILISLMNMTCFLSIYSQIEVSA